MEQRTAVDGMLYSTRHVRLRPGVSLLAQLPGGLPRQRRECQPSHLALGGEGRAVWLDLLTDRAPALPQTPRLQPCGGRVRYTLTLLTPGLGAGWSAVPGQPVHPDVPGAVACCVPGAPLRIGGFDNALGVPERIRSARAAGAVWWIEADANQAAQVAALHGNCVGAGANQGYGQLAVGAWPQA
jgi:CRISPR-associated protein Cmr3